MVKYCCVYGCTNDEWSSSDNVSFHMFPKEMDLLDLWKNALRRNYWEPSERSVICSAHFTEDCFDRDFFNVAKLKPEAIPTIFPGRASYLKKKEPESKKSLIKSYTQTVRHEALVNLSSSTVSDSSIAKPETSLLLRTTSSSSNRRHNQIKPLTKKTKLANKIGKPAKLVEKLNPDWVPSVNMGYKKTPEIYSSPKVERLERGIKRKKVRKEVPPLAEPGLADREEQELLSVGKESQEFRKTAVATLSHAQQIVVEVKEEPAEEPDESFWRNSHFNSLQGYIEETNCLTSICRICFEAIREGASHILTSEQTNVQTDLQKKVQFILPNINLGVFSNSLICRSCIDLIDYSIELQEKWVRSQEQLEKIIDKKKSDKAKGNDVLIMVKMPTEERILNPVSEKDDLQVEHFIIQVEDDKAQTECGVLQIDQTKPLSLKNANQLEGLAARTKKQSVSRTKSKRRKVAKNITSQRSITCGVCKQILPTIVKYVKHSSQHIELKNRCYRCKDTFPNTKRLFQHLTKCLEEDESGICKRVLQEMCTKYVCQICKQEFLFSWYLEQHLRICKRFYFK